MYYRRRFRHLQCEGCDPCKGRLTCFPFIFGLNCFEFPNLKMRGMYLSPANKVVPTTSIPCRQGGEGVGDKCSQEMQNKLRLCEPSWLVCNLTFSYAFTKVSFLSVLNWTHCVTGYRQRFAFSKKHNFRTCTSSPSGFLREEFALSET